MADTQVTTQAHRRARGRRLLLPICLALAAGAAGLVAPSPPAVASFPGANGRIAYTQVSANGRKSDIFTVGRNGTGIHRLTATGDAESPAWSPDGRRIAFVRMKRGQGAQIWVMGARGGHKRLLLGGNGFPSDPTWSPDAHRIAFLRDVQVKSRVFPQLFVLSLVSHIIRQVTHGARHGWAVFGPAWSPAGGRIAFTRSGPSGAGNPSLFTIHPNGTGLQRLTRAPQGLGRADDLADWSPDGSRIVFTRSTHRFCTALYLVSASGGRPVKVLGCAIGSSWAPNGKRIAFINQRVRGVRRSIWTVRPDGSDPRLLLPGKDKGDPQWQPRPRS